VPDVVTYTNLVSACSKMTKPNQALAFFREMTEAGLEPGILTLALTLNLILTLTLTLVLTVTLTLVLTVTLTP
jgi:pentatricopeptide repeat protein